MGVSKDSEKKLAYIYYVEKYKTAKETAVLSNVSEKTVNDWVSKHKWKELRESQLNSSKNQINQIKELISVLTQRRLKIETQISQAESAKGKNVDNSEYIAALHEQCIRIGDDVSKWNKTLQNMDESNRISLGLYLEIMDDIFTTMQKTNPELHAKTLDFQTELVQTASIKYS